MKYMKLVVVLGLILAFSGIAEAITLNIPGYDGRFRFKYENWDMATSYPPDPCDPCTPLPDTLYDGISTLDALSHTTPPGNIASIPYGTYAGEKEDAWAIFRITEIRTDDGTSRLLWSDATSNHELVGMLYGAVDNALYIQPITSEQRIQAAGFYFDLYEQPEGLFDPTLGSGGRIDFDNYTGIGQDAQSSLVIAAVSTPGVAPLVGSTGPAEQRADFTDNGFGAGDGESSQFLDIVGGSWMPWMEVKDYYFGTQDFRFGVSQKGDIFIESDVVPYDGPSDWILSSDDPGRGLMNVPEPITMLGAFLGLGGLGGYIRRRRRD